MSLQTSASPPDVDHLRRVLARAPVFASVPDGVLTFHFAPGGTTVWNRGERVPGLYLVVHGRLRVQEHDGLPQILGEGGVVGAAEVLADGVARSTVTAARDTELALLPATALDALTRDVPGVGLALGQSAVALFDRTPGPAPELVNIAVVPVDEGAPLSAFCAALADALGDGRPLTRVDRARFVAELGDRAVDDDVDAWDATDRRVVRWILEQEARSRFVVYETDPTPSAWTRRCLRMADRVLLVARSETAAGLRDVERAFEDGRPTAPVELVLLHPPGARPSRTRQFLGPRPFVRRVHHVRLDEQDTVARVSRSLSGRAVGVVFGGGGARGLAHVGAVSALRALGVPIDLVGGTSAGGGIAGMVALGWDEATMVARTRKAFVDQKPFRRFTVPYHSLLDPHLVERVARGMFGDEQMEDQLVPMFCLSADLVAGRRVVHREGPIWRAVLATTALPGVLPPVWWDGRLLVDGGVLDNNPVRTMRELHEGPILLFDVGQAPPELVRPADLAVLPSNALSLWHRLKPWGARVRVPTIAEIVSRTMTMARPRDGDARHADLYVRPAVEGFGLVDFARHGELVRIGFAATIDAVAARVDDAALLARLGTTADRVNAARTALVPAPNPPLRPGAS